MTSEQANYPTLIVVTGRPGAGKTTLSRRLAQAIRCPLISRDEMKEGLVNTLRATPNHELDLNLHIYHTFFDTLDFLLNQQITLIAEAAFQHKLWSPKLEPLQNIARIKIILCTISPLLAKSRFVQRGIDDPHRAQFHDNSAAQLTDIDWLSRHYDPLHLPVPTLEVDTSDGYQPPFDDIMAFINS